MADVASGQSSLEAFFFTKSGVFLIFVAQKCHLIW
jgi:hypothetical protein